MDKTQLTNAPNPLVAAAERQVAMMSPVQAAIQQATRARPGQPTKRTPELIETILDQIACGRSLMSICAEDDMPGYSTVKGWMRVDPELRELVNFAYEEHADTMDDLADDILSGGIASTGDFYRDKERVAHLRWRLGKLNKKFRDKAQLDIVQHQPVILDLNTIEGEGGDGV